MEPEARLPLITKDVTFVSSACGEAELCTLRYWVPTVQLIHPVKTKPAEKM